MSYGTLSKTLTITTLSVSSIDAEADTLSGDDAPGANIEVWIDNTNPGVDRWVQADFGGHWSIDFSTLSPESTTYDIVPGTSGQAKDYDQDGDSTQIGWRINNPSIQANLGNHWVQGREWPLGTQLILTVPGTDFSSPATVEQNPNNPTDPNDIGAFFELGRFRLQAGMQLNITDGVTPRSLTIAPLLITNFDLENDRISGTTDPNTRVQVCANVPGRCITRWVTADGDGNWTAFYQVAGGPGDDAETVDLQSDSAGWAAQTDENGNQTWADWNVPTPKLAANAAGNWAHGSGWPYGSPVTLTIEDPGGGAGYTTTAIMGPLSWDPNNPTNLAAEFDLGSYQLHAGMLLTASGAGASTTMTLSPLHFTNIDLEG